MQRIILSIDAVPRVEGKGAGKGGGRGGEGGGRRLPEREETGGACAALSEMAHGRMLKGSTVRLDIAWTNKYSFEAK